MTRLDQMSPMLGGFGRLIAHTTDVAIDFAVRAFEWLELASQVRKERRDLASLDARMLKDIGLDSGRAHAEVSRAWDDLPHHRVD